MFETDSKKSSCWGLDKKPSIDFLKSLKNGSLKVTSEEEQKNIDNVLEKVRRDKVDKPVIYIGAGTCGLGAGADKTKKEIERYLANKNIDAEIVEVGCIGLCAAEPLVDIKLPGKNRISFKNVTVENASEILDDVFQGTPKKENTLAQFNQAGEESYADIVNIDEHPFFAPQTRYVLPNCGMIDPVNIDEYIARGGFVALHQVLHKYTPVDVCQTVIDSGLRGRGGGGFTTGMKWKFAQKEDSSQKYLVCNADEGDPGAFMDRAVIEGDPYRLIEGMAIAAYAIGASKAYIYIRAEYPLAIDRLRVALDKAREYGFIGEDIYGSGFNLDFIIKMGAGAFVCGEETALIHSIEGKRGMPRPRPPYPAVKGLFGKPTIINNVETLSNIPLIMSEGAEKFAAVGTENSKGTKVFALSGKVTNTGLVEVAMGTTVDYIVHDIGGGVPNNKKFKAVQIGGPSGGCIPEHLTSTKVDYEELKTVGAMMGSGGLVVMDEETCMVDLAKYFMDFIQRESCGKCIPCREGTKRMLEVLESITRNRASDGKYGAIERFKGVMYIKELAEVIQNTSLCGLGQSAPNPVLSTIKWFKEEYEEHIFNRHCPAGACTELIEYSIIEEKCKGCTLCAKACPTAAIMGSRKAPHYIIPDKCISCGACLEACPFDAVAKK